MTQLFASVCRATILSGLGPRQLVSFGKFQTEVGRKHNIHCIQLYALPIKPNKTLPVLAIQSSVLALYISSHVYQGQHCYVVNNSLCIHLACQVSIRRLIGK